VGEEVGDESKLGYGDNIPIAMGQVAIIGLYLTLFESMVTDDGWFCLCHSLT